MNIHLAILYVVDPARSAEFYERLMGQPPVERAPNFAMFRTQGASLGLWARHDVDPAPAQGIACSELDWVVESPQEVERIHRDWVAKGVTILQPPTTKDFGHTFTACDPDGHRLRVLVPA